jgi:hypothetical protein
LRLKGRFNKLAGRSGRPGAFAVSAGKSTFDICGVETIGVLCVSTGLEVGSEAFALTLPVFPMSDESLLTYEAVRGPRPTEFSDHIIFGVFRFKEGKFSLDRWHVMF